MNDIVTRTSVRNSIVCGVSKFHMVQLEIKEGDHDSTWLPERKLYAWAVKKFIRKALNDQSPEIHKRSAQNLLQRVWLFYFVENLSLEKKNENSNRRMTGRFKTGMVHSEDKIRRRPDTTGASKTSWTLLGWRHDMSVCTHVTDLLHLLEYFFRLSRLHH